MKNITVSIEDEVHRDSWLRFQVQETSVALLQLLPTPGTAANTS
jgi:hypothetical protein